MAPLECPPKALDEKYADNVVKFVSEIRNGKLQGSNNIATATVTMLEKIINNAQNATACDLLEIVREVGRRLLRALPHELVPGNVVRRVLRAIRDEYRAHASQSGGGGGTESLQRLVLAAPARRATLGASPHDLKEALRDHIAELRLELESSTSAICSTAREHIHSDELILTCGASTLVEKFLLAASQSRRYKLLVCETADSVHKTHAMAARLSAAVPVTVISNASVYAVMSRVNKVVMCAGAALAGGAVLTGAGGAAVTLAAKHHSVPVIVLAPLHKLSPLHACDPRHFNSLVAPSQAFDAHADVRVLSPRYDLVPPDHITLFITSLGGSSPSYIYRLLSELYAPSDYQL